MRHFCRYTMWFLLIGLGVQASICGCCRHREEFSLYPNDYELAPRLIRQFFRDNLPGEVQVAVHYCPTRGAGKFLDIDFDTGAVIMRAVAIDAAVCGDPRGWGMRTSPMCLYLAGPHYTLQIELTVEGYSIGCQQAYRFTSPTLSRALEKACEANGVLTPHLKQLLDCGAGAGKDMAPNPDLFAPP